MSQIQINQRDQSRIIRISHLYLRLAEPAVPQSCVAQNFRTDFQQGTPLQIKKGGGVKSLTLPPSKQAAVKEAFFCIYAAF